MVKAYPDRAASAFVDQQDDLIALARSIVGCRSTAEDLVQDSWLRWRRHGYEVSQARPVLMRIVRNLAIDWHRRRKREARGIEAQSLLYDPAPDSERVLSARQELQIVVQALQELPARTVHAFKLSRVDGIACAEIGRRMGISESRAYQLVGNALIHVIKRLEG
ncbi:MAG: sigma-70 family RNA polymerase sigma factor [Pseudomonadota bacterium]